MKKSILMITMVIVSAMMILSSCAPAKNNYGYDNSKYYGCRNNKGVVGVR